MKMANARATCPEPDAGEGRMAVSVFQVKNADWELLNSLML